MRHPSDPDYDETVAKAKKFDLEEPAPILDEEGEETLAAIDEGSLTLKLAESCLQKPRTVAQVGYRPVFTQRR